jgi:hypothetical protein
MVMRRLFMGVQTSGDRGWCSQMVHCSGSAAWPEVVLEWAVVVLHLLWRADSHLSHIDVSQQGSFTAFTATRLHRPQRSFAGISSGRRVLRELASVRSLSIAVGAYAARLSSSSLSLAAMTAVVG